MKNHEGHNSKRARMSSVQWKRTGVVITTKTTSDGWSKLPEDVLRMVVDRIPSEKSFLAFRLVCKDWSSAIPRSYWPRTPWLLAKRYQTPKVVIKGLCSLVPGYNSLGSLFDTELHWRYWGSFTGWILGQHLSDYSLKLINPVTKAVIDLPRLHHPVRKGLVYHTPGSDSRNPTIGVMAISHSFKGIAMIDNEYKDWMFLEDEKNIYRSEFKDLVWYKDNVAAIRADGTIVFFDKARVVRSLYSQSKLVGDTYDPYLVESSGDLLIIACLPSPGPPYKVYRLNLDTGDWIHVTGLGKHSLFVGKSYSISCLIKDETVDTWRPSCIYDSTYCVPSYRQLSCYDIIKQERELHNLPLPVTDIDEDKCYDFIWYMPAVGSN